MVAYFKILIALKQQLAFQTSKRDIILQPGGDRLQLAMDNLMLQMLEESGWHCLRQNVLLGKQIIPNPQKFLLTS